ncbi:hypothetical protein CLOM_g5460 [Closterium sp. NIES-68]|nr:hypothetical protein CLOM_g5460 [Closterium sp. NIES-68]GJP61092.1 hypothetical protein CLOP_g18298 [Closterium sp. NIES-67]
MASSLAAVNSLSGVRFGASPDMMSALGSKLSCSSQNLHVSLSPVTCRRRSANVIRAHIDEPSSQHSSWPGNAAQSGAKLLAAAAIAGSLALGAVGLPPEAAHAALNRFEAETRGEFGIGSAAQYGSADLRKTVHKNENFRRANFTSADMREADFSGSIFAGGYLEKAVAYKTNFEGADFTDALMDRMVLNEANLTDAVLLRVVLTRSDLGGAIVDGADFSDAILDLPQKQALCKYAKGENPVTGMSTRKSLGCGNRRGNAYGSPSSPLLSDAPKPFLSKDGFCDDSSGLCKASF